MSRHLIWPVWWLAVIATAAAAQDAQPTDAGTAQPSASTTQPAPPPVLLSDDQRIERLRALLGPRVELSGPRAKSRRARVRTSLRFDNPSDLQPLAPVSNVWEIRDGSLHGSGVSVSQIVFAVPLLAESCTVKARLRSDSLIEMSLLNPLVERFDGTRAVGRLHFGRMDRFARSDWIELSSHDNPLKRFYSFRFPDRMQEAMLALNEGELSAKLTVDDGSRTAGGRVLAEDLSRNVYVSLAGGVNNKVAVDRLDVEGWIDLESDETAVLTGMGREFWGEGREVTIHYRARGHFRRLLHNGQPVGEQQATEGVWWPTLGPLHQTTLTLNHGDVLAFELGWVDDEGALHAVGVDQATGMVVLATHPLAFETTAGPPPDEWFRTFGPRWETRPRVSNSQDQPTVEQLSKALGVDFPGLPIIGPWVDDERRVFLKTQIR
ncbi:MAG TPA: hypothetical protein VM243_04845 [Phycisphaerae bacterium]|nr:hypothetical protein [Phycisphaerae bacterium]